MKLAFLVSLFALTACLYASVGFGGGSTYTALLVAGGMDYALIPIIALSCNITRQRALSRGTDSGRSSFFPFPQRG
jgi:hypothetical protein